MAEVVARDERFVRESEPREEGLAHFKAENDFMKIHFVERFTHEGEAISLYRNGAFVDFCRGPHVPSTGRVKAFKVMSLSGAYWLGDEKNPQLQRIYGTAFFSKKDLDDYLQRLEEAKKRDHRRLGKELELFTVSEDVGAGLPLWLPKGATIRRMLEEYILEREREAGYQHVYSPEPGKGGPVCPLGPLGALSRRYVSAHGSGDGANGAAADELPASYSDLRIEDAQLPRTAGETG